MGFQAKGHSDWGVLFSDSTQSSINNFNKSWKITYSPSMKQCQNGKVNGTNKKISPVAFGKAFDSVLYDILFDKWRRQFR